MTKQEFEKLAKTKVSQESYKKIEMVYMSILYSDTNGKQEIADFYNNYDMNGIEKQYNYLLDNITNCSICPNKCQHEQAYRRLPKVDGGLGLCKNLTIV